MTIGVIGAGAFGTALACAIAQKGVSVVLLDRISDRAQVTQSTRRTARLPGVVLDQAIHVAHDFKQLETAEVILLAVPMQKLRETLLSYGHKFRDVPLVACCKGIELNSGLGPVDIIHEVRPGQDAAILTGPSFAIDIANGLPTALTIAASGEQLATDLRQCLSAPALRLYSSVDLVGAQLGGALKNVVAIGCGAVIGAGLGESARAALMTRGFAEMSRIAAAMGGKPVTLSGLAGFGDLALTCTSEKSRNYQFGKSLGEGQKFDPVITVEGAPTARAMQTKARGLGIDTPITDAVVSLIGGQVKVSHIVEDLLSRPLRSEA